MGKTFIANKQKEKQKEEMERKTTVAADIGGSTTKKNLFFCVFPYVLARAVLPPLHLKAFLQRFRSEKACQCAQLQEFFSQDLPFHAELFDMHWNILRKKYIST